MSVQVRIRRFTVDEYVRMAQAGILGEREMKFPAYARCGLGEAGLVDLVGERIEAHREPGPQGYGAVEVVRRGADLEVAALSGMTLKADEILGE